MEQPQNPTKQALATFLSLSQEDILLIKRKHKFMLLTPIFLTIIFGILLLAIVEGGIFYLFHSLRIALVMAGVVSSLVTFFIGKSIIEWNFHWYIITNKKILEVCYIPLTTYYINEILMDQVKCTEVDIQADGILNELLDMGNIELTFDRPTHQEGFYLHNIKSARRLGLFLTNRLLQPATANPPKEKPIKKLSWYKDVLHPHTWRISEDIFTRPHTS